VAGWQVAVGIFSGKLRDRPVTARDIADLLAHAPYWWVGDAGGWEDVASSAELEPVESVPESNDALLLVLLEVAANGTARPTSRPEAASKLRAAADRGQATVRATFLVRDGALPDAFRR